MAMKDSIVTRQLVILPVSTGFPMNLISVGVMKDGQGCSVMFRTALKVVETVTALTQRFVSVILDTIVLIMLTANAMLLIA
jgi:hypothetical protein